MNLNAANLKAEERIRGPRRSMVGGQIPLRVVLPQCTAPHTGVQGGSYQVQIAHALAEQDGLRRRGVPLRGVSTGFTGFTGEGRE